MKRAAAVVTLSFSMLLVACGPQEPQPSTADSSGGPAPAATVATAPEVACNAKVNSFGPSLIVRDEPFNVQADGRSAYWVAMAPGSAGFSLEFEGQALEYTSGDDTISFMHEEPLVSAVAERDVIELDLLCDGAIVDQVVIPVVSELPSSAAAL